MRMLKAALILIVSGLGITAMGQNEVVESMVQSPDSVIDDGFVDLAEQLPPLSILIDSAIANATSVDLAEIDIMMREYEMSHLRKDWTDLISVSASYRYTDIGVGITEEGVPFQSVPTRGYVLGANFRMPLSYVTSRREKREMKELDIEKMEVRKEAVERDVKEQVIRTYNQLLLLQRQIRISIEAKEFTEMIFQMSEERFLDGDLSLEQMGANTNLRASYASQYEQLITDFNNTYALLERLVGVPLSKLQN